MASQTYYQIVVAFVVVVLVAASPLVVEGQILGLNLPTRVCCTPSGNCTVGAAGLANVTGVLRCVNPLTGLLTTVGQGISTANGTLTITAAPMNLVGSVLTGVVSGGVVPCILTETFQLVNQTLCPVINTTTTTLVGVTTLLRAVPNLLTGLLTAILGVTNLVNVSANVGAGANI